MNARHDFKPDAGKPRTDEQVRAEAELAADQLPAWAQNRRARADFISSYMLINRSLRANA